MSYIRCAEMLHQYHGVRDVPKDILIKAKEWEKLYPDDIEFKESYFGLLLTHLYYAQTKNARQAQQRIFDEMKKIAERANYDEYNEQNDLKISIRYLQRFYGYK